MRPQEKKTILLVEDEAIIAMAEAKTIRSFGYEVIVSHSGDEAVMTAADAAPIDLVLMDIDLGRGMSGPEAAELILTHQRVPVVFLTSHAEREMVEKVRGVTRYGYVVKNSGSFVLQTSIEMAFELFEANENLRIQYELSRALNSSDGLRQGLEGALEAILRLKGVDCGGVYVVDPATGALDLEVHYGLSPGFIALVSRYKPDSPNVLAVKNGEVQYGNFIDISPLTNKALKKEGLRAMASIPIMSRGQFIALFNLASHRYDSIPAESRILLETMALQIGITLMRLRSDASLRISEERYRRITENMSDIVSEIDSRGVIRYVSPSRRRILGGDPEDLIGTSVFDGIHPDDRERIEAEYREGIRTKTERDVEYRNRHQDGHYVWLRSSGSALFDISGEHIGMVVISSDITARKKTEHALRLKNLVFNASIAANVITDLDGIVTEVNDTYLRLWGYDRKDEVLGRHLGHFLRDGDEAAVIINALDSTGRWEGEHIAVKGDGSTFVAHGMSTAILDENGAAVGYQAAVLDITDRKRTEEALRESEERFRSFVENASDIIYTLALDGTFAYVSPNWKAIVGHETAEVVGRPFDSFVHPDDVPACFAFLERVAATGEKQGGIEYRVRHKNGEWRWHTTNASLIRGKDGKIAFGLGIARDITGRRRAGEEIRRLLSEKELLLREVHHRIKNNMSTMKSMLALQSARMKNREAAAALDDAGSRMQSMEVLYQKLYLTEDLREMPAGDYLPALAGEIVSMFPVAPAVTLETCVGDFILGTRVLAPLGIIVNELITNAMKYAFTGRDSGVLTLSASKKVGRVTVVIGDDGNGIPESFDFNKSESFGLKLVDLLVKQVGGTIRIERAKGSRFVIEFSA